MIVTIGQFHQPYGVSRGFRNPNQPHGVSRGFRGAGTGANAHRLMGSEEITQGMKQLRGMLK